MITKSWLRCAGVAALFVCCKDASMQQKLEIMYSAPVNLHLEQMECWQNDSLLGYRPWESKPLKLCVYVSQSECTSCYLKKMFQWQDFVDMEENWPFSIYFIFTPQDGCEDTFHRFFFQAELNHPFYLDKDKAFLENNPHIPPESPYHVFLLDEENNIVLVGDILHNTVVENKFKEIVENHNNMAL